MRGKKPTFPYDGATMELPRCSGSSSTIRIILAWIWTCDEGSTAGTGGIVYTQYSLMQQIIMQILNFCNICSLLKEVFSATHFDVSILCLVFLYFHYVHESV